MKKTISILLSLILMFSSVVSTVVFAGDTVEFDEVYNSAVSLEAALNAGETSNGQWSFMNRNQLVDANKTTFTAFVAINADRAHLMALPAADNTYNYSYKGNSSTDKILSMFCTSQTGNQNSGNMLSLHWMRTAHWNATHNQASNSIAKVFTAPKSGKIQISAVDADGNAKIYGKRVASTETSGAQLYIEKTSASSEPAVTKESSIYNYKFTFDSVSSAVTEATSIAFEPITIDISEGEKLWFIVNAADTVGGNAKFVHWHPVVSYIKEATPSLPTVFKASEAWSETTSGNTYWKWEQYDLDSSYAWKELNGAIASQSAFGTPLTATTTDERISGNAWKNNSSWERAGVGQYWLIPRVQASGDVSRRAEYAVSRTFTAPAEGNIKITTEDGKIYGGSKQDATNNKTAFVRITKNGSSIWDGGQIPYTKIVIQEMNFSELTTTVAQGDVIRFEVYNGEDNDQGYGKSVYWAPVITYYTPDSGSEGDGGEGDGGEGDGGEGESSVYAPSSTLPSDLSAVGKDEVFTLTFDNTLEAMTSSDIEIVGGVKQAAVNNFNQTSDAISFAFSDLEPSTTYTVNISNLIASGTTNVCNYSFNFTTKDFLVVPIYDSDAAWNETSNTDTVWAWLYRNTLTMDTINPYVKYTLTAQNTTNIYVAPIKGSDGKYDYSHEGATGETSRVFCDSQTNAYMRNALGRYWARLSVGTSSEPLQHVKNEIVKEFTAPETGKVKIYAKDMDGNSKIYNRKITENNKLGAVVKILRKTDSEDVSLWSYEFDYSSKSIPSKGVAECELTPFEIDVKKGEKIWFVISGELGGSAYAKQVFFRPVVEYLNIVPNVTATNPSNGENDVPLNFEHIITYDHYIQVPDIANVEINNSATVSSVTRGSDEKTLKVTFANLKPVTKYTVKIKGIREASIVEENSLVYEYSFTTAQTVNYEGIKLGGSETGTLVNGSNEFSVVINNTQTATPFKATMLVAVCNGTEDNYTIESVHYARREDILANTSLNSSVNIADKTGRFVKVLVLESSASAKALLPIKIFN